MEDLKKYLSVSDFTRLLKYSIEDTFPELYLRGEISNFRPSSSGHWYFSIKDKDAAIRAIIFKNSQSAIINSIKSSGVKNLENGQEVLAEGRISLYEKSGDYSIIISRLIPAGKGELSVKFEILKDKLLKEGLFEQKYKKELPKYPSSIGIVTSPTGAALQDILNVLKRRFQSVKIIVFPASVQGEDAKYEIVKAIKCAEFHFRNNTDKKTDVLIVARGGGSIEDLWAFNEEIVARAIFDCRIPVITGIGHEIDFTISDFCADLRAPTPSAAAEIVVQNREDLINSILSYKLRIEGSFNNIFERILLRYQNSNPDKINQSFERIYEKKVQDINYFSEKIENTFKVKFTALKQRYILLIDKMNNLSPLNVLKRGYSILLDERENVVRCSKKTAINEELKVILSEGRLSVIVKEIKN